MKTETMTSRERVLKAINHEPVDRMPIDLGSQYCTGISGFAYHNLREYLGLSTDNIEIVDIKQFLARVDEDILERFHCDCVILKPVRDNNIPWNPRGKYNFQIPHYADPMLQSDGSWLMRPQQKTIMPKDGYFFDTIYYPGKPGTFDDRMTRFGKEAERIYKDTDYFSMYFGFYGYFNCDNVDWLCRMLTEPEKIYEENKQIHEWQITDVQKVIDSMGKYTQAIAVNSDLGLQTGPLCNPEVYNDLCAPFLKDFCDYVHQNSDLKIFLHCCGSIKPFIPTLIDCGIDILNPVQISAYDMDPTMLKREFGDKITFWGGGCNTQQVLNIGTPEDVTQNVRELTDIFKPGSGFVFNPVHNIMGDVKPENIVAMYDAAYENSFY